VQAIPATATEHGAVVRTAKMAFFEGRRDRLDAFREGDHRVLTELFHFYVDDVASQLRHGFRLGASSVPGTRDADREKDLVQEVFLRAFAPPARLAFNALLPYRPYLIRIARNLLIDEARRRGTSPISEVTSDELDQAPSLARSADDELGWRRLQEATAEYCRSLSPEMREFVRLRFESGLSQRDVASQLGVTRRSVRTQEETARAGLEAFLLSRGLGKKDLPGGPDSGL
jgi:RNA polymerase sigma factor (sigma-70 family)